MINNNKTIQVLNRKRGKISFLSNNIDGKNTKNM